MLLAIDAGNTNIVFAVHDGKDVRAQFRAVTKDNRTADEYYVWLAQLLQLEGIQAHDITGAIISSVVPPALFNLRRLCSKYFRQNALVIGDPDVDLGIVINADRPRAVGADRLVNTVAGYRDYGGNLILIDFGTATTFDVVGEKGSYEGGIIAPGVNLSMEALHLAAAQLPRIAVERPATVIGRDTIPAMQSGIFWGYIALVEGLVARIRQEYAKPMKVVGTGGLAHLFRHSTPVIEAVDHDLTVRGLSYIYERNATKARKPVE